MYMNISKPQLPRLRTAPRPRCQPAQDTFWPIPGLIKCAGVTGSHVHVCNMTIKTLKWCIHASCHCFLPLVTTQVQAFGNVYNLVDKKTNATLLSFSSVYDCEGYFDISSWMGTFVVVIITVMIYLATLALFSTQTVDRFDDPRGRTITVENLH